VELIELLRQRRMTRSFRPEPVDQDLLDQLCVEALRAPTAGNSAGVRMTTIAPEHVAQYFEVATDASWRATSPRFEGLSRAGAVVIVTSRPQDYTARYGESDKGSSGLADRDAWTVPYWHTDAAMATMALLLLVQERGLGASLWGNFRHDDDVLAWARITDEVLFGSVLVGVPDGQDHASASLARDVISRGQRVRRVGPPDSVQD
jgi:nitroreductase